MLHNLADLVAAQTADTWLSALSELGDRLRSNPLRLVVALTIAFIVAAALSSAKWAGGAILAGLGSFWLTWHLYNTLSGNSMPLLLGEETTGSLWDISFNSNWALVFFIAALIAAGSTLTLMWDDKIVAKVLAVIGAIGIWSATMLLYIMVWVPAYQHVF